MAAAAQKRRQVKIAKQVTLRKEEAAARERRAELDEKLIWKKAEKAAKAVEAAGVSTSGGGKVSASSASSASSSSSASARTLQRDTVETRGVLVRLEEALRAVILLNSSPIEGTVTSRHLGTRTRADAEAGKLARKAMKHLERVLPRIIAGEPVDGQAAGQARARGGAPASRSSSEPYVPRNWRPEVPKDPAEEAELAKLPLPSHELGLLVTLAAEGDETAREGLKALEAGGEEMELLVKRAHLGDDTVLDAFRDLYRDGRGHDGRLMTVLGHASLVQSNRRRGHVPRRDRHEVAALLERLRGRAHAEDRVRSAGGG